MGCAALIAAGLVSLSSDHQALFIVPFQFEQPAGPCESRAAMFLDNEAAFVPNQLARRGFRSWTSFDTRFERAESDAWNVRALEYSGRCVRII
ncbi:hypothetical protein AVEN_243292-1 [Araneus ventricosus]|uniref:Uncharacterized protein n=1 Tax=Araneus ventricosus TaxID=182803 RepID=A0A4Y2PZJ5_ARAVE|nr:hypothetical protein AVEN_243292-1 [Araneus ventricosus]